MTLATSPSLDFKKGTVSIGFENGELYSGKVVARSQKKRKNSLHNIISGK